MILLQRPGGKIPLHSASESETQKTNSHFPRWLGGEFFLTSLSTKVLFFWECPMLVWVLDGKVWGKGVLGLFAMGSWDRRYTFAKRKYLCQKTGHFQRQWSGFLCKATFQ